jgi:hypothetical protein
MKKVQAWELLNNADYSSKLNMRQFKELLLEAGYSEEDAQDMANERGCQRLEAGVTM